MTDTIPAYLEPIKKYLAETSPEYLLFSVPGNIKLTTKEFPKRENIFKDFEKVEVYPPAFHGWNEAEEDGIPYGNVNSPDNESTYIFYFK